MQIVRVTLLFLAMLTSAWAAPSSENMQKIDIELFVSSTCPHCKKAETFIQDLTSKMPELKVRTYVINNDKSALEAFNQRLNAAKLYDFAVPAFFFCGMHWQGFDSAEKTGAVLLNAIQYCQTHTQEGSVAPYISTSLQGYAQASFMEAQLKGSNTTRSMVVLLAIMDAFNPCALFLWCAVFAFLFFENKSRSILLVAVSLIVCILALHYLQQAFPEAYGMVTSWSRIPAVIVGGIMMYPLIQQQKIQKWLMLLFISLIFIYQQSCKDVWSLGNHVWLLQQHLSFGLQISYQLLYQLIFALPLLFACLGYFLLSKTKHFCEIQLQLSKVGFYILGSLSILMIGFPQGFSNYGASMAYLLVIVIFIWVSIQRNKNQDSRIDGM